MNLHLTEDSPPAMLQENTRQQRSSPLAAKHPRSLDALRDELVRAGVERILAQSLEVEADLYIARHRDERDASGKRQVVRNGYLPEREILCGAGLVRVRQPRVHDARVDAHGRRHRYASTVLPAYARTTSCIERPGEDAFFHGLATGDLTRAFQGTFGTVTEELPQSFLPRLRELWEADRERIGRRSFDRERFAQLWADEIPVPSGAGDRTRWSLVLAASTPDGVDVLDARAASAADEPSWAALLGALSDRGLELDASCLHASAPSAARAAFR
jgi:hypothetical protein